MDLGTLANVVTASAAEQFERRRGALDRIEGAHVTHREWTP